MAESTVPFWVSPDYGNSLWDSLWLGGTDWPGAWQVKVKKARDVDKAKQSGQDGNTLTDKGYVGAVVTATGRLWKQDQLEDFQALLPNFDPRKPGVTRSPLDIYTPVTALFGVDSVYIKSIEAGHPTSGGVLTVTIELEEWFPATKTAANTKKVKGFDGTDKRGAALNDQDFRVSPPSSAAPNL
jgi:hypothetical protein